MVPACNPVHHSHHPEPTVRDGSASPADVFDPDAVEMGEHAHGTMTPKAGSQGNPFDAMHASHASAASSAHSSHHATVASTMRASHSNGSPASSGAGPVDSMRATHVDPAASGFSSHNGTVASSMHQSRSNGPGGFSAQPGSQSGPHATATPPVSHEQASAAQHHTKSADAPQPSHVGAADKHASAGSHAAAHTSSAASSHMASKYSEPSPEQLKSEGGVLDSYSSHALPPSTHSSRLSDVSHYSSHSSHSSQGSDAFDLAHMKLSTSTYQVKSMDEDEDAPHSPVVSRAKPSGHRVHQSLADVVPTSNAVDAAALTSRLSGLPADLEAPRPRHKPEPSLVDPPAHAPLGVDAAKLNDRLSRLPQQNGADHGAHQRQRSSFGNNTHMPAIKETTAPSADRDSSEDASISSVRSVRGGSTRQDFASTGDSQDGDYVPPSTSQQPSEDTEESIRSSQANTTGEVAESEQKDGLS